MAQMNQTQIRYARQRAEQIKSDKLNKLSEQFTVQHKRLSTEERIAAIKAGNYRIKDNLGNAYYINDVFVFDGESNGSFDREGYDKSAQPINEAFTKLMDELILGDNEEALKLLKAFEAV